MKYEVGKKYRIVRVTRRDSGAWQYRDELIGQEVEVCTPESIGTGTVELRFTDPSSPFAKKYTKPVKWYPMEMIPVDKYTTEELAAYNEYDQEE